jgi:4-carboxymuconolactone decarboxylase
VSDTTYSRAVAKFCEPSVVELASIQGYYTYLAMVMNAGRVGVPESEAGPVSVFR